MKVSPLLKLSQLTGTSVALTTCRPLTCNSRVTSTLLVSTCWKPEATPPVCGTEWRRRQESMNPQLPGAQEASTPNGSGGPHQPWKLLEKGRCKRSAGYHVLKSTFKVAGELVGFMALDFTVLQRRPLQVVIHLHRQDGCCPLLILGTV